MLLIDGGSRDEALEVVRSHGSDRIVVQNGPDEGIYDPMTRASPPVQATAVGFLNSDGCFADPGVLAARHVARKWRSPPFRRGGFRVWLDAAAPDLLHAS